VGAALAGQWIGKYEILQHLSTGGMAELYLARQSGIEQFQKLCVIKRILPGAAQSRDMIRMLVDEARITATLIHSNIVQVFDIGESDGEYFLCMEYLHGRDVLALQRAAHRRSHRLALDHALSIVLGVCAGLHYAHEKTDANGRPLHIVHRDVSPSNVIVTYDGCVKLVDFGLVKTAVRDYESRSGSLKGRRLRRAVPRDARHRRGRGDPARRHARPVRGHDAAARAALAPHRSGRQAPRLRHGRRHDVDARHCGRVVGARQHRRLARLVAHVVAAGRGRAQGDQRRGRRLAAAAVARRAGGAAAMTSCYVLELSVQPGGSRWAELHTYPEPGHLRLILEAFCANEGGLAAYHAIWYGATLGIWVIQRGEVAAFVDLHPHIRATLGERSLLLSDPALDSLRGEIDEAWDTAEQVTLELFWDPIELALPALVAPVLARGDTVALTGVPDSVETYLDVADELAIGSLEAEQGEAIDPPFDLDAAYPPA
jgi:hypothetical protein